MGLLCIEINTLVVVRAFLYPNSLYHTGCGLGKNFYRATALGCLTWPWLHRDNNRWSVPMKRISFRTAREEVSNLIPRFVQGTAVAALTLAVALSASAKDAPSAKAMDATGSRTSEGPVKKHHWYQVGTASWYGPEFQGRKTAAGERFDMNSMTCAHPTLPMGTWLKVTNLKNRQTAYVRVNDRGPVIEGRIVDLSRAAAHAVGLKGIGKVKLEALPASDPELLTGLMAQSNPMPFLFEGSNRNTPVNR